MTESNKSNITRAADAEQMRQQDYIARVRTIIEAMPARPKAYVETYGCQQNSADSERLKGMLCDMGYEMSGDIKSADLVLYNTCAVRENAELRVFGNIGALKHKKAKKPDMLIGVCGCMMQQEHIAKTIKSKYKHVDMVFGTHALRRFPEILFCALGKTRVFDTADEAGTITEGIPIRRDPPPLAKVSVTYGCNNFCTYCIVPYVRGRERSRSAEDILNECRETAEKGYKEVMLLGQNVNSYGNDLGAGLSFSELLEQVCRIDGIERIRFMTSHPKDISDRLIEVMAREKKVCNQLHLPIQSGSDRVLEMMNRRYTRASYLEIIRKVRAAIPDIVLTTDVIVGFPGETNEDFEQTLSLLKEVEFDMIFSFIYSKRVGTPAAEMPDCLTDEEKHANFDRMLKVQNEISKRLNERYLGTVQRVLVEGVSKTSIDTLTGRTEGGKVVNFSCPEGRGSLVGELLDIEITDAQTWSLFGRLKA